MKLTGPTSKKLKMLSVMLVSACGLFGREPISSKAPQKWLTDFEVAKSLAAKESKLILVCCCLSKDNSWGSWHLYNGTPTDTVCPRLSKTTLFEPNDLKFIRQAKWKYILLRVNLADGLSDEKCLDFRLNHPKIKNDDSDWWGCGDIRIVDAAGSFVKRVAKLEDALSNDLLQSASGYGHKQIKKSQKKPKSDKTQPEIVRVSGTKYSTPGGWMDNFRYAQEIALQEEKDLLVVFLPFAFNCWMTKRPADTYRDFIYDSLVHHDGERLGSGSGTYRTAILTSPIIINALRKDFILVYLEVPGGSCPVAAADSEMKENEHILRELLKKVGKSPLYSEVNSDPITILMTNDGKLISVVMNSWETVKELASMKKLNRRHAEQQLAEAFIKFINEKKKSVER